MATEDTSPEKRGSKARLLIKVTLAMVVIVGVYAFALPRFAEFGDVWGWIGEMTWLELTTLLVLGFWNMATYWILEVASFPGLNYWRASKVVLVSTAIANTVPGGGAFGIATSSAMYRSYGYHTAQIATALVTQGVWNNFVKLGMPIIALALLAATGEASSSLVLASLVGVAMLLVAIVAFWLVLRSERSAKAVARVTDGVLTFLRRIVRKPPATEVESGLLTFRSQVIGLVKKRWPHLTAAALVSHVTLYLVLLISLRHMGVSQQAVSWIEALAAFAFVRLISAIPITPGGLGVVELGLTAALVGAGGNEAKIVAAVLVFRALTFALAIPFGAVGYLGWQRSRKRHRAADLEAERAGVESAVTPHEVHP